MQSYNLQSNGILFYKIPMKQWSYLTHLIAEYKSDILLVNKPSELVFRKTEC
jgi:hypothetical protein